MIGTDPANNAILCPVPTIHPTAIIDGDVQLADDVTIGPHCVLTGPITIGAGTRLIGSAYLQGPLRMGSNNFVYPFACLGFSPQHVKFDPATPGRGVVIGDGNTFREQATIHRAFTDDGPTTIGDRNFFMATSHAAHDCIIGSDCVLVNQSLVGGHVTLQDRVIVGGGCAIHQFCRIGYGAMLSGGMATGLDIPPWFVLTGHNACGSLNVIGLRRSDLSKEDVKCIRWVYKTLYRRGLSLSASIEVLHERKDEPIVADYIAFIEGSDRGICRGVAQASRGQ
jgi:UDP-N-acetylglucosamine acyltransferase